MIIPPPQMFSTSREQFSLTMSVVAPRRQASRDVSDGRRSLNCFDRTALGRKTENADFKKGPVGC
jgi:hypothetical protein